MHGSERSVHGISHGSTCQAPKGWIESAKVAWKSPSKPAQDVLHANAMRRLVPLVFLALLACGGPDASSPERPRPPYEGRALELFDDVIEPRAVGLALEDARSPRTDPVLRERTQTADGVARVTVKTVTARGDGVEMEYLLAVNVVEKLTEGPLPGELVVRVDRSSPSLGIVKSLDARLGGKTFVAFVREFAGSDGEPRWHFHFAPDTKDEVAAVSDAIALQSYK